MIEGMAGMLKALQNIFMGKPVFDNESDGKSSNSVNQTYSAASFQNTELPLAKIDRIEYLELGTNDMSLNAHIKNFSHQDVVLQKIEVLGKSIGLGLMLHPGEAKEINEIYRGRKLPDSSNRHFDLEYKGADGRFFRTVHTVQYKQEAGNTYGVVAAQFDGSVRKI